MMDDLKDIFLDERKFEDLMNIIKGKNCKNRNI